MKRALTVTLALALFGSLMFMGFAGSAAATSYHDKDDGDNTAIVDQDSYAETNQKQYVSQQNNLKQGNNYAYAYGGNANAGNFAEQNNANAQLGVTTSANFADVSQY
jgi:uncharacterized protein YxeA